MRPFFNADQLRASDTKKIHIAKKDLGMDDETYRALLMRVTGKASSKDCTPRDRQLLLEEFTRLGFKVKGKSKDRPAPKTTGDRVNLMSKIEALLAEAGRPWLYTDAMAKRMFKVEKLDWCTPEQLTKIIAALVYNAQRQGRRTK